MLVRCLACEGNAEHVSLSAPIDYEYGVIPESTFSYRKCQQCGSEWLFPRPDHNDLPGFYPPNYHAHSDDHGALAKALVWMRSQLRGRTYRRLLPNRRSGALFDVGAGDCRHFVELQEFADWHFSGVEIQPAVAERARRSGFDVATGTLEQMDIAPHLGKYDIVSMNHVLEHVVDPMQVVARCWRLLKPGGWLIGQLPTNSSWESGFGDVWAGYHYPRHLQVFSRRGLETLLSRNDFRAIATSSAPHCQVAISLQNKLIAMGSALHLEHGRSKIYGLLLLASLPFELLAWIFDQSGTIDFKAQK